MQRDMILSGGGGDAAYYEDGALITCGHTDDVMERVLERFGVDIEQVSTFSDPDSTERGWGRIPKTLERMWELNA